MSHNSMARLVYMANQIGKFFEVQKHGRVEGIAKHIKAFWDPRMRAQMENHITCDRRRGPRSAGAGSAEVAPRGVAHGRAGGPGTAAASLSGRSRRFPRTTSSAVAKACRAAKPGLEGW